VKESGTKIFPKIILGGSLEKRENGEKVEIIKKK